MFYFENEVLNIKRFTKILFLEENKISFLFKKYSLEIQGKNLKLVSYYEEEAFVKGNIERIIFNYDVL